MSIELEFFKDYKVGASKRNLEFNLTLDEFISLMEQNCVYCGAKTELHEYELQYMQKTITPWKHNGIDRINTKEGYIIGNVDPCCSKCNYAKHEMTEDEFKDWLERAYKHYVLNERQEQKNEEISTNNFMDYPQFNVIRNTKKTTE